MLWLLHITEKYEMVYMYYKKKTANIPAKHDVLNLVFKHGMTKKIFVTHLNVLCVVERFLFLSCLQ